MALVAWPPQPEPAEPRACPEWLPLRWGNSAMLQRLLEAAGSFRESGRIQKHTWEAFKDAFTLHMQQCDQMHLAFSAALPLFFEALRSGEGGGGDAQCGRGQLAFHRDHIDICIPACIRLLERLQSLSRFGDRPPACPPEDIPKWKYVRELCSQAALSLDVARLVYLEQRRKKRDPRDAHNVDLGAIQERMSQTEDRQVVHKPDSTAKEAVTSQLVLDSDSSHAVEGAPAKVRQSLQVVETEECSSSSTSLQRADIQEYKRIRHFALVRAGRFLKAVQAPMDQLREESESLSIMSGVDPGSAIRELLYPCFGSFVEQQLLPLYVRDIELVTMDEARGTNSCLQKGFVSPAPCLHKAWQVLQYYCAVPVDIEDERRARQILGVNPESRLKRRHSTASSASTTPIANQKEPTLMVQFQDLLD